MYHWRKYLRKVRTKYNKSKFFELKLEGVNQNSSGVSLKQKGVDIYLEKEFDKETLLKALSTIGELGC